MSLKIIHKFSKINKIIFSTFKYLIDIIKCKCNMYHFNFVYRENYLKFKEIARGEEIVLYYLHKKTSWLSRFISNF